MEKELIRRDAREDELSRTLPLSSSGGVVPLTSWKWEVRRNRDVERRREGIQGGEGVEKGIKVRSIGRLIPRLRFQPSSLSSPNILQLFPILFKSIASLILRVLRDLISRLPTQSTSADRMIRSIPDFLLTNFQDSSSYDVLLLHWTLVYLWIWKQIQVGPFL